MGWFNKTTKEKDLSKKITTPTISDPMKSMSGPNPACHITKMPTAVAGGKTKAKRYRKKKALSEADFNAIKALSNQGMPNVQIAVVIGVTSGHIGTLLRFDTWEDYCKYKAEISNERTQKLREQRAEAEKIIEAKQIEEACKELEQWQFIVGWSSDDERIKANAVRDLAKALGLRVEE